MDTTERQTRDIAKAVKNVLGDEQVVTVSLKQRKIPKTEDFVMVYQSVLKKVLEGEISLSAVKIFAYLMSNMSFENFIGIDLQSIAEKINMPLRTVKQGMHDLKNMGMLISIKNNFDARRNDYRLNPVVAWKGKVTNRIKAQKTINPNQTKMFEQK